MLRLSQLKRTMQALAIQSPGACRLRASLRIFCCSSSTILFISFSKRPMRLHLWKRSWTTLEETPNHSRCRAFHWHPVHNTYQMALMTARSEALGLPPRGVLFFVCLGRHFLSFLHRGLGRRK